MSQPFAYLRLDRLPSPARDDRLLELPERMRTIGYDQQLASSVAALSQGRVALSALLRRTAGGEPAQLAYRLWLLARWLSPEQAARVFGPALLERLLEWGLLAQVEGRIGATVDLYPVGDDYLATDRQIGLGRRLEAVYPPGIDSFSLRWMLPTYQVGRALDLCTGSGIQALGLQASFTDAVDLSPRAVEYARFNFALNQPSRSRAVHQGALYDPLEGDPYDLIVSNPPFFSGGTFSNNQDRTSVRHTVKLPHGDLLHAVQRLLHPNGRFCVILPYIEGLRFKELAESYMLYPTRVQEIHGREGKPVERILLQLEKERKPLVREPNLAIRAASETEEWTPVYRQMTADFYLHF
ncbi:MAG: methyltransferase [Phaeodactylibacter sp.]|nr:methyltransferase [Phaeodactylibacter sp.]